MRGFFPQNSQHIVPTARNCFLELDLAVRTEFQRGRAAPVLFAGHRGKRTARCGVECFVRACGLWRQAILIGHLRGRLWQICRIRVGSIGRTGGSGTAHQAEMTPRAHRKFGTGRDNSGIHAAFYESVAYFVSARLGEISYTRCFVASREQIEFAEGRRSFSGFAINACIQIISD